jgi:Long-chain fatty acid transport protein
MKKIVAIVCLSIIGAQQVHSTTASIKGIGMGGACVSYPLDSGVIAFNPAGIVNLCNRFDAGLYVVYNDGSTTVSDNLLPPVNRTDNNTSHFAYSPEVGGIYHLNPNLALGFSVYNEKDLRVKYKDNFPLLGTSPVGFEYILEVVAPTVAAKFFDHHAVSFTLNYMVQRFRLKGVETLAHRGFPQFSAYPDFVTNKGYNYSNGLAVTVGYLGDFFNDTVRLGVAWRSKAKMNKLSDYKGFVAQRGTFDIPEVIRAGISVTPFCAWTFAFDYQLIRYDQIPALHNGFTPFATILGSAEGSGFGWTNQHFYRLGVNYDFSETLSFRIGFRHANENFKGTNVAPNLLTLDTTVDFITAGMTWLLSENLEVNSCFAYGFDNSAKGSLPLQFGGGSIKIEQESFIGALGLGWYY